MAEKRRRGRPPRSEGASAREEILRTAREMFGELGYERTTFTEIAERAGYTRPAVNHYFPDKVSLYRALLESVRDTVITGSVEQAVEQQTLFGRLSGFLESAVQVDSRDRTFARFIAVSVLDGFRHPQLREPTQRQVDEVRAFVRQALASAVEAGEVRADLDVPAVTEMLIAVMWGMGLYAGFLGSHEQLEDVVEQFSRLVAGILW
ncbi:AcrR family transcriptional regulator [Amycolatopsis bartoniae]|uniref:TetR family transcriptional regulator n=1 Tax=Amycolatopsis bartoniae TaxID=941986 RepID=A0A8H9IRQ7_9PSEU|nr:TetR/AcrR family transcriptional regulator [Amycolatopsis bartoniae]MBB2934896.1 AcrR family transcriptional regulator [Amycolatopsis bartoniae]TVS99502.1 TetR/AcrR family transcriptional regulator [Amycolatopsis bartoniae]GHF43998.1 TetR family transcriptional regulator [Amycolatopsis bartoniae]